jgi:hypothetical protein
MRLFYSAGLCVVTSRTLLKCLASVKKGARQTPRPARPDDGPPVSVCAPEATCETVHGQAKRPDLRREVRNHRKLRRPTPLLSVRQQVHATDRTPKSTAIHAHLDEGALQAAAVLATNVMACARGYPVASPPPPGDNPTLAKDNTGMRPVPADRADDWTAVRRCNPASSVGRTKPECRRELRRAPPPDPIGMGAGPVTFGSEQRINRYPILS